MPAVDGRDKYLNISLLRYKLSGAQHLFLRSFFFLSSFYLSFFDYFSFKTARFFCTVTILLRLQPSVYTVKATVKVGALCFRHLMLDLFGSVANQPRGSTLP